ncbi:uncharacterized protein LOC127705183 isoform X10 [Mytilus californianus]|uniref:uncharacterized protein LOC127705183 isoform X10 n=1 Tax=Mytilus californianus TaxID=6549 RepID=UPI00224832F0|nr:uncharacterized protein LOC127705183 isoform X10 [Mytilus californianus]
MNQYQKVYMNQIHSSSLLGQLAQMWKSQMLCDALIRTGNVTTKAHRVVLVAACPMLQSMDNASVGSHLEVRLAADIKQEAVNSFLQYLYEGFMMLSEENCKDVEKVARLLQVDSVTKCCIDFYNCLQKKTGVPVYSNTQYKYSSADLLEFRHVRTTDLQKTLHERMMKRAAADSVRPTSPSGKRQRMQQQRPPSPNIDLAMFGQKADDTLSMAHSYMGNIGNQAAAEPWERVPRIGAIHSQRQSHPKPGVIEIVEDSLEILQTQPPDKDGNKSAPPIIQKSLAISVSSQVNSSTDVHVVNVNDSSSHPTAAGDGPIMSTGRDSITVSPLTVMPGTSSLSSSSTSSPLTKDPHKSAMDKDMSDKQPYAKKLQSSLDHQSSTPQRGLFPVSISPANMSPINQVKKSFAAGSASQAASMSQSHDSPAKRTPTSAVNEMERPPSSDSGKDLGTKSKVDDRSALNSTDMAPDLSIVKVEPTGEAGLDMYVDVPEESMIQAQQREQREHDDESDLELEEASGDWSRDEMSNEAAGGDQNNSWYIGQFKGKEESIPIQNTEQIIAYDSNTTMNFDPINSAALQHLKLTVDPNDPAGQQFRLAPVQRSKPERGKQRPGPKPTMVRLKFYFLPDWSKLPSLSKLDPLIQIHQDQGFGYPAQYYNREKMHAKPWSWNLDLSDEDFKESIRDLYPLLEDKDFTLYTVDQNKRLRPVPFKTAYFKAIKYQGTVIIKMNEDRNPILQNDNPVWNEPA